MKKKEGEDLFPLSKHSTFGHCGKTRERERGRHKMIMTTHKIIGE